MSTLGIDIGGANLKFADSQGKAISMAFPMWKRHRELAAELAAGRSSFLSATSIAVTMTGEMADCFASRSAGVCEIVAATVAAFEGMSCRFFNVDGGWYTAEEAVSDPMGVGASNWRAIAQHVASTLEQRALLIDIGSTTTDIIGIEPRKVLTRSRSDLDRLVSKELVYTGVERSNVAGLLQRFQFKDESYPVVNELFATALDAYLSLGLLPSSDSCDDTADGQARTVACAKQRLARAIGTDAESENESLINAFAEQVFAAQRSLVTEALRCRLEAFGDVEQIILSGHGGVLARAALEELAWRGRIMDLVDVIGSEASRAACAYAVAKLYEEELRNRTLTRSG